MGQILGLGMTHYPNLSVKGNMSRRMKISLDDPLLADEVFHRRILKQDVLERDFVDLSDRVVRFVVLHEMEVGEFADQLPS